MLFLPLSYSENITLRNIKLDCEISFDVAIKQHDRLSDFTFDNLKIVAKNGGFDKGVVDGFTVSKVKVNGKVVR